MLIGEKEKKTSIRLKNVDDFEFYTNAIDVDYDPENVISTGWLYIVDTLDINKVNRSQYVKSTNVKQDIVEYTSNNCYIPRSGNCFIKYFNHLSGKDFIEDFFTFIRNEQ